MHKIALTLAALGLASTAAFAQTSPMPQTSPAPMNFSDVDGDANGELSLGELQMAWPDLPEADFTTADLDASGGLSPDEISSLQAAPEPASAPAPAAPLTGTPQPQL